MKIVKTASGKRKIKLSKKEWEDIGKKAGWLDASRDAFRYWTSFDTEYGRLDQQSLTSMREWYSATHDGEDLYDRESYATMPEEVDSEFNQDHKLVSKFLRDVWPSMRNQIKQQHEETL